MQLEASHHSGKSVLDFFSGLFVMVLMVRLQVLVAGTLDLLVAFLVVYLQLVE